MTKPIIHVAVGIIRNEFHQIYLTQRLDGKDFAHSWEFPGGKLEDGESPEMALKRELEEEVGIMIVQPQRYAEFSFEYPQKIIHFYFYLVEQWINQPFGREGQTGNWIAQDELKSQKFPPANAQVIKQLLAEIRTKG